MARARGLAPWSPRAETLVLLDQVNAVLREYRSYLPLTARQIFYRLVGSVGYAKTEQAYDNLCEKLNRARRSGLISFDAIRDDGGTDSWPIGWNTYSEADFWRQTRNRGNSFRTARQQRQDSFIELWCEAAGMVPMLFQAVGNYGVPVFSSGGFDSLSLKWDAAQRIVNRDEPTIVLHVGDFDPSGEHVFYSAANDVRQLVHDSSEQTIPTFIRLAVLEEQIASYGLDTAPPKRSDNRSFSGTVTAQVEAFAPDVLSQLVQDAVTDRMDLDVWEDVVAEEGEMKENILKVIEEQLKR